MASPTVTPARPVRFGKVDRYFEISQRGSTIGREVRGGLVTFFAMCYIIVLNPLILGGKDGTGHYLGGGTDGPNTAMIAAATALVAGVMTILMGSVAKFPMALATGLGLNAVVAYTIASRPGVSWQDAMGLVVISGILITILVLTGFREAVFKAVPPALKTAISVGIGLFIALVGFYDGGFITQGDGTALQLGIGGSLDTWPVLVFSLGLIAIIILSIRKVKGALLIGIIGATVLAVIVEAVAQIGPKVGANGKVINPHAWSQSVPTFTKVLDIPNFSLLGQFSVAGAIRDLGVLAAIMLVFSLMLADFFDTMGTMVAIGSQAGLLDEGGKPPRTNRILVIDALACVAGGAGGVSSNTGYIESTSGVAEGARSGLASVVTGVCFLLATFLAPLVSMVPQEAATPALVFVGFLMMTQVAGIKWTDWEVAVPAFLTIALMPFTYSITVGLGAGFIAYAVIKLAVGKAKQVHPLMWVTAALFVVYFAFGPIRQLLGV